MAKREENGPWEAGDDRDETSVHDERAHTPAAASPADETRVISRERQDADTGELFAWIVAVEGNYKGKMFRLFDGQNLIGRGDESHIQINDRHVSEMHAAVRHKDGAYLLWDLGSTNGTKVNGVEVTAALELNDGDRIEIGKQVLVFKKV